MVDTTTTDKYFPSAELLESVGVKAMKVSEPTTTLSALLGSLGGIVFCEIHLKLWSFILLGYYDTVTAPRLQSQGSGRHPSWLPQVRCTAGLEFCPPASHMRPVCLAGMISVLILIRMRIGIGYVSSRNGWLGIVGNLWSSRRNPPIGVAPGPDSKPKPKRIPARYDLHHCC